MAQSAPLLKRDGAEDEEWEGRCSTQYRQVTNINRDASRQLNEMLLASTHGGQIPVHTANGVVIPDRAVYGITLTVISAAGALPVQQVRGKVVVYGEAKTLFFEYFKTAAAVLIRESGW